MYTFSTQIGEMKNVNIDLRKQLDSLDDSFSIDVLYIRNNKFVRCSCFDDVEKTGDTNCKRCFGSGYFASVQKFRTIESSTGPYGGNNKIQVHPIGAIDRKEEVCYFDYSVLPKERDFVLKVSWKNGKPVDVLKVLEVSGIYEMRGDSGRMEVYGAVVTNRPDSVTKFNTMLKGFSNKALYVLGKGGKYIWPTKLLL